MVQVQIFVGFYSHTYKLLQKYFKRRKRSPLVQGGLEILIERSMWGLCEG